MSKSATPPKPKDFRQPPSRSDLWLRLIGARMVAAALRGREKRAAEKAAKGNA